MEMHMLAAAASVRTLSQRQDSTRDHLIQLLTDARLGHFRFEFDVAIGHLKADLLCRERGCVILLSDPETMNPQNERLRDEAFLRTGYAVFRLPQNNLRKSPASVSLSLLAILEGRIEEFVEGQCPQQSLHRVPRSRR